MKILVTGFDPFGGEKVNPAYEAVKLLPDTIAGAEVIKLEIPTVFSKSGPAVELMARVNSQLRRYTKFQNRTAAALQNETVYAVGGIELNEETVEVLVDGNPVKMTPTEFKILALLMRTPGRVYSAEEIYERVWNEKAVNTDTIMVHVRNIRDKIEINPKEPKYLKVVWGVGYKIEKQS